MLHELLLALSGFSGDIIVHVSAMSEPSSSSQHSMDSSTSSSSFLRNGNTHANQITTNIQQREGFYLDDQLPFLHESEKNTIQQLCQMGFYYKKLSDFMTHYSSGSLYILALKQGLQEILEGYLRILTKAEQEFCIWEEEMSSYEIGGENSSFSSLHPFSIPSSSFQTLQQNNNSTGAIMPLTYLKQLLRDYEIIFPHLLDIVKQVQAENLSGAKLLDFLYNSTFSGIPIIEASINRLLYHCNVVLMKQISAWMIYGIISNHSEFFVCEEISSQPNTSQLEEELFKTNDVWNKQYVLKTNQIPSYISLRVANKILFIGKAIKILQTFNNISKTDRQYKLPNEELIGFKEAMKIHETARKYNSFNFEFTIDKIRITVGTHLWNLVVMDCDLLGYIKSVRDLFFIGMGDFFLCFIEESDRIFSQPLTPQHLVKDLKNIFKQSSLKSSADNYKFLDHYTVSYNKISLTDTSNKYDLLRSKQWPNEITLEFNVGWPLNLFFTDDLKEMYNEIFKFLLTCKRVQHKLTASWIPLTRNRSSTTFSELSWTLLLRSKMANFVNSLQFYLHTEVIEGEFLAMEKSIKETKDFETAKRLHQTCIAKIHQRCFLNKKQLIIPLLTMLDQCLNLCDLVSMLSSDLRQERFQQSSQRLEQIEKDFERNKNLLIQIAPFLFAMGDVQAFTDEK
ncbi:hypothetical protein C9374_000465 [Naegleria lovaniensis]|uniref:Spindle pole body component n=1 Tax=Naegleria lovaniensis TaxID=51637 RepID=A0AA88KP54_NAELO|nr:uncharacterized protein C9374_000465 [Naegleria lovaniensis]KAG2388301.1 hypothetical protein C9374_000465 [Naegleria lovaniensis]